MSVLVLTIPEVLRKKQRTCAFTYTDTPDSGRFPGGAGRKDRWSGWGLKEGVRKVGAVSLGERQGLLRRMTCGTRKTPDRRCGLYEKELGVRR